ncbi:MAG: hypothetical protein M0R37_12615 [Bacteroidales bacterium]|nr:hypothetical protein [Bacteroidales bacterium]
MSGTRSKKPWYKMKTVWIGVASIVTGLATLFTPAAPAAMSGILAGVGLINIWLRTTDVVQ